MRSIARAAVVCSALLMMSSVASAQATRTWISGVGDDANPCSRTAPCRTFAGAITKTAAGGIMSVLDPAAAGAVTITKSITIDGGGVEASILGSGTTGIVINIPAGHVTIRNISIYGAGSGITGIRVVAAAHVSVEDVIITGFGRGIDVVGTGEVNVKDSLISRNSGYGVFYASGRGALENVRLEGNVVDGLRLSGAADVTIRNSVITGSGNLGVSAVSTPAARLTIDDCLINNNAWGIGSSGGATVWVSGSTISNSTSQGLWFTGSSSLLTFGNNRLVNNTVNGTFSGSAAMQ